MRDQLIFWLVYLAFFALVLGGAIQFANQANAGQRGYSYKAGFNHTRTYRQHKRRGRLKITIGRNAPGVIIYLKPKAKIIHIRRSK